jgi:hypothetical protein
VPSAAAAPASSTARVSSSAKSGTPSVRSTISSMTCAGSAAPPATPPTSAAASRRPSLLTRRTVTLASPAQGGWNSGRWVITSSMRMPGGRGDEHVEQLARGRVRPVRVLQHGEHGPLPRQRLGPPPQRRERARAALLGAGVGHRAAGAGGGQPEQVGEERDLLLRRPARREDGLELGEARFRCVMAREAGGALEPRDERLQRAVGVVGRAEPQQRLVRHPGQPVLQRRHQARLADPRLAREHHHLPLSGRRPLPASEEQLQLLFASHERSEGPGAAGLERFGSALDHAPAERPPGAHRVRHAPQPGLAEVGALEQRSREAPGRLVEHHRPGLGQALQPRREVGRLARHAALARLALAHDLAHHHRPGGDPDPGGERARRGL